MAFLLIDGYNLIGTAHRDLEKARNNLVSKLSKYSAQNGHDITVVFDGWKDGQARETRLRTGNITIIYSRIAENADTVIKRILSEGRRSWIVVSSDREISDFAYGRDCVPVTAQEFEKKLFSGISDTGEGELERFIEDDDEDAYKSKNPYKGSPKKLSKKAKKKLRALEKL
jgi:predicted RNA-binding protein with PIN domain